MGLANIGINNADRLLGRQLFCQSKSQRSFARIDRSENQTDATAFGG
jgi:hypothetical protein